MSYRSHAFRGFAWTTVLRGVIRSLIVVKLAILARLLTPADFGTVGITVLILGLLEIFTETGINVYLLQQKADWKQFLSTAWVISLIRGVVIAALLVISAPLVSQFFHSHAVTPLLYLTALIPLIRGFINPACIQLLKELKFKTEFFYRSVLALAEFISAVGLVYLTGSAAGLIISVITSATLEVVLSWWLLKPRPKFAFNSQHARDILQHGKYVTAFGLFDYTYTQGDNVIVGHVLGSSALGLYQNAYKLATLPMVEASDVYYKVNFPIFTQLISQNRPLKQIVLKNTLALVSLAILVGFGVFVCADLIVRVVLGPNWSAAADLVRILAFAGSLRAISFVFNPLLMANGLQRLVSHIIGLSAVVLLLLIFPLTTALGVQGAAIAAVIAALSSIPLAWFYGLKTLSHQT